MKPSNVQQKSLWLLLKEHCYTGIDGLFQHTVSRSSFRLHVVLKAIVDGDCKIVVVHEARWWCPLRQGFFFDWGGRNPCQLV
jgi:hypothetical protein